MKGKITFSVFAKPWKLPLSELGEFVASLGFDAVELPVRPGYLVNPDNVSKELPKATRLLASYGLAVASIAGPIDEATVVACAEAGVPTIRTMVNVGDESYMAVEARTQREYDALVPVLDRHGVSIGVQNHYGRMICNAMGLRHLVEKYDPRHIAVVLDAGHNGLNGEDPEMAIDIVWSHLCMVNLKNAFWVNKNGPEAPLAEWVPYWTDGRHGLASWPRVAVELKKRDYGGVVCLTAEYTDEASVNRLIAEDIAYARSLFA